MPMLKPIYSRENTYGGSLSTRMGLCVGRGKDFPLPLLNNPSTKIAELWNTSLFEPLTEINKLFVKSPKGFGRPVAKKTVNPEPCSSVDELLVYVILYKHGPSAIASTGIGGAMSEHN